MFLCKIATREGRRLAVRRELWTAMAVGLAYVLAAAFGVGAAWAQPVAISEDLPTTIGTRIAKATPDECYSSLGENLPFTSPPCFFSQPKVNQSYPWGTTVDGTGNKIIIGTAANPHCLAQGVFGLTFPYETDSWACEFGLSPYAFLIPGLDLLGDFRPGRILAYDKTTHAITDLTPTDASLPFGVTVEVLITRGFRFAQTIDDVIIVGGPTLTGNVQLFFYHADTLEFLGTSSLTGYNSIRKAAIVDSELYIAMGSSSGGEVLRWTGSGSPAPCASCNSFETVASLDGLAAFIVEHEDRLFVSTWPAFDGTSFAKLYMSRELNGSPLTAADANGWTPVWNANDYDPDPVMAATYAGGALASFDGHLFFGTMHLPDLALGAFLSLHGVPPTDEDVVATLFGTLRPSVLFRGKDFGTPQQEVELAYGDAELPVFVPGGGFGSWVSAPNNLPAGKKNPLLGYSGYFNRYNHYTWAMTVWDDRLWIGTLDATYAFEQGTQAVLDELEGSPEIDPGDLQDLRDGVNLFFAALLPAAGADLFYMTDADAPAFPESLTGLGNFSNWGVRNLLKIDDDMISAMANPSNLLTNPLDSLPEGGWELIRHEARPDNTFVGADVSPAPLLPDGVEVGFCSVDRNGYTYSRFFANPLIDFEDEIEAFIEDLIGEAPEGESGFNSPQSFLFLDSTAGWRDTCGVAERAEVCIPYTSDGLNPELRQLQFNDGLFEWVGLETSSQPGKLCAEVTANYLGAFAPFARNCDVDGNDQVDRLDLTVFQSKLNQPASPSDPFDVNGDGVINVLDMRTCVPLCTNAACAP